MWGIYFQPISLIWQMALRQLQPSHLVQKWKPPTVHGPLSLTTRQKRLSTERTLTLLVHGNSQQLRHQLTRLHMNLSAAQQVRNYRKKWKLSFQLINLIWQTALRPLQRSQWRQKLKHLMAPGASSHMTRTKQLLMEQMLNLLELGHLWRSLVQH